MAVRPAHLSPQGSFLKGGLRRAPIPTQRFLGDSGSLSWRTPCSLWATRVRRLGRAVFLFRMRPKSKISLNPSRSIIDQKRYRDVSDLPPNLNRNRSVKPWARPPAGLSTMTTALLARCPTPVAPLPPRDSARTLTLSMPKTMQFSMPIDAH